MMGMEKKFLLFAVLLLSIVVSIGCQSKQKLDRDTPMIVWWADNMFPHVTNAGEENGIYETDCPKSGVTCLTTQDRSIINKTTDRLLTVMIYGTDFRAYEAPVPKRSNHLWALYHEESPLNNQVLLHEEAMRVFNFSATFKRDSNYPLTTQHIPDLQYFRRKIIPLEEKNRLRKEGLAAAVYLQSHCDVPSDRDRYVEQLMKYMKVDSYGDCLYTKAFDDNTLHSTSKMNDEALLDILAKYKFHLVFENAICDDYFTEKIVRAFHVGAIPVYYGSRKTRDFSPLRHILIEVIDYPHPKELADYIYKLDTNDYQYGRYLLYKKEPAIHNDILRTEVQNRPWSPDGVGQDGPVGGFECYVCEEMHKLRNDMKEGRPITPRVAPSTSLTCPPPKPSLGSIANIPTTDNIHRWIEDYYQSKDQAVALEQMVKDGVENAETLWDYIERRYKKGRGALQHTEL